MYFRCTHKSSRNMPKATKKPDAMLHVNHLRFMTCTRHLNEAQLLTRLILVPFDCYDDNVKRMFEGFIRIDSFESPPTQKKQTKKRSISEATAEQFDWHINGHFNAMLRPSISHNSLLECIWLIGQFVMGVDDEQASTISWILWTTDARIANPFYRHICGLKFSWSWDNFKWKMYFGNFRCQ